MPYIDRKARDYIGMENHPGRVSGELNYNLSKCIKEYLDFHGLCYQTCNDIIGALEGCKLEFYRRVVAPYENDKCQTNGDVY